MAQTSHLSTLTLSDPSPNEKGMKMEGKNKGEGRKEEVMPCVQTGAPTKSWALQDLWGMCPTHGPPLCLVGFSLLLL